MSKPYLIFTLQLTPAESKSQSKETMELDWTGEKCGGPC